MMKSAQESEPLSYPISVKIDASEAFIEEKLRRLLAGSPSVNGGIETMRMDGRSLSLEDRIPNVLATGCEMTRLIAPGFSIHMADGEASHDWSIGARASQDCVRLRFAMRGEAQYRAMSGSAVDKDSVCTFIVQPADASLTSSYRRGIGYRYCSIDLSRSFLIGQLGILENLLPSSVTGSWEKHEVAFGRIELDRATLPLLQRLFTIWSDDIWATIQAQGIGLLIIAQVFAAWRDQYQPSAIVVRLRPSERAALERLRDEAERRCPEPIPISEAQSICGLNRNKIHYGFKEMFGMSLQRYCSDLWMRKAVVLLQSSALTVAEIAELVGFSEPTNFSAAFRQHIGQLPSEIRKSL